MTDPDLMTLWWAPAGTPLPADTEAPLHPDLQPAGQIERNLHAADASAGAVTYDLTRGQELVPAVRLTLRWPHDDWRKLPGQYGDYVALVFDADAQGRGVAARVELAALEPDLYDGGQMDVVAHLAETAMGCVVWYPVLMGVSP